MGVVHIVAEAIVFFAAILLIYYFFQITQALGDRKKNIRYLIISAVVLFIAYPDFGSGSQGSEEAQREKGIREKRIRTEIVK